MYIIVFEEQTIMKSSLNLIAIIVSVVVLITLIIIIATIVAVIMGKRKAIHGTMGTRKNLNSACVIGINSDVDSFKEIDNILCR